MEKETQFKTKIDKWSKKKNNGRNGLLLACHTNETQVVSYLLQRVFTSKNGYNIFIDCDSYGETALSICLSNGNLTIVEEIFRCYNGSKYLKTLDINRVNLTGQTALWRGIYVCCVLCFFLFLCFS